MKVYISTDMEGLAGTTDWCEVTKDADGYEQFREQMTKEVCAACEGALEAGATDVLVKDAHSTARNLIAARLPKEVRLIRGWSRHPYFMMQGIESDFDAAMMIGYHSMAGGGANPLAHTISSARISGFHINDHQFVSEFFINTYTAGFVGVPVVLVSGDRELCDTAEEMVPGITTVAVKEGSGASTTSIHPDLAVDKIREGAKKALLDIEAKPVKLPDHFRVELDYFNNRDAFKASFYPGASLLSPRKVLFEASDWFDVLRMIIFIV